MYQRTTLDNRLSVLSSTMAHTQSVSMAISIAAGSRYESQELAGVSHFLEHLPFKGTRHWPTAREVSEAIEGVGGVMNASTDREMTTFWCKVAKPHFRQAFAVLLDLILNPLLDPAEVEKEREVIQEELRMSYDHPGYRADLLIDEALWPDQAMGRDVGGTPESVASISLESIQEYMDRQYNPANAVVSVAGNITHEEVVEQVQAATLSWAPKEPIRWEPVSNGHLEPIIRLEQRRTDQSHLCLGLPALSLSDPDRYSLTILNVILGDGMSSRLFLNLRERQGLAYDVQSSVSHFLDCGSLVVSCGVEPRKSRDAIQAVVSELSGMHQGAPPQELTKAKEYCKGRLLLRMEDSRAVAGWLGTQELLEGDVTSVEEVVRHLDAVTSEEVARVAHRLFAEDKLNLAVVGPHRSDKAFRKLLRF